MTPAQRVHLMADLWPKACQHQGWAVNNRKLRMTVLSRLLGRTIESANEINQTDDFDRIKRELGKLADNVAATVETDNTEMGIQRRLLWKHYNIQIPCLRVYVADVPAYLKTLLKERFKVVTGLNTIEDLDARSIPTLIRGGRTIDKPSQLLQFVMTIDARLSKFRNKQRPKHSPHDMLIAAGLKCDCKECCDSRIQFNNSASAENFHTGDADETNLVPAGHDQSTDDHNQPF